MIKLITDILSANKIDQWRINETHTHTAELYFIRHKLDMPRIKDCTLYSVTVFRDFTEGETRFLGNSRAMISEEMTPAEVESRLLSAYQSAAYVKNPWYELADPVKADKLPSTSPLADAQPEDTAMDVAKIMFAADTAEDAFLNSVEIFVVHTDTRILGSNGLDVSFAEDHIEGELVAQCLQPTDVEQYRDFGFEKLDEALITAKVQEAVQDVRSRAAAIKPPQSGNYNIVLKGSHLATLLEYYAERSHAAYVAAGYSDWQVGSSAQGESIVGEKLDLQLVSRAPYSEEGIPMPERALLSQGTLQLIHGPERLCRYAGVEPTGNYTKVRLDGGTLPLSDMLKGEVLEPISFSDFQMDAFDGHFKGEIRLAFLHHQDGSVETLTGGSVNGSLPDLQGDLAFSLERYEDLSYAGPLGVLIKGVPVAGE